MNMADRKLINIFKTFIERVFVPQLPKMDINSQQEWTKFSNILNQDQPNLSQLQVYVDTLPGLSPTLNVNTNFNRQGFDRNQNKSPLFSKIRKQSASEQISTAFNPSRTFGGQRARMMFPLKDFDEPQQQQTQNLQQERQNYNFSKEFSKDKEQNVHSGLTTQAVLPTLQKLFKLFSDNQLKMEKIAPLPPSYEHKNYYN